VLLVGIGKPAVAASLSFIADHRMVWLGNSALDIAYDIASVARSVTISTRSYDKKATHRREREETFSALVDALYQGLLYRFHSRGTRASSSGPIFSFTGSATYVSWCA